MDLIHSKDLVIRFLVRLKKMGICWLFKLQMGIIYHQSLAYSVQDEYVTITKRIYKGRRFMRFLSDITSTQNCSESPILNAAEGLESMIV